MELKFSLSQIFFQKKIPLYCIHTLNMDFYVTFTGSLHLISLWKAPWLEDRLLGNGYSSCVMSLQYFYVLLLPFCHWFRVTESKNKDFAVGDMVVGFFGWRTHTISDGKNAHKLDPSIPLRTSTALGILGMPGWGGLCVWCMWRVLGGAEEGGISITQTVYVALILTFLTPPVQQHTMVS